MTDIPAQERCEFCNEGAEARIESLGDLIGPVGHHSNGGAIFVHRLCALWSPEVHLVPITFQIKLLVIYVQKIVCFLVSLTLACNTPVLLAYPAG